MEKTDEVKRGSGILSLKALNDLREEIVNRYEVQLQRMGFKPKKLTEFSAGFRDGFNSLPGHLEAMGVLVIVLDAYRPEPLPKADDLPPKADPKAK